MSPTDLILSFLGVLLTIFVLSVVFGRDGAGRHRAASG